MPKAEPQPEFDNSRESLLYWLLRAHQSGHRQGWEEGPSVNETMQDLHSVLCNAELDPSQPLAVKAIKEGAQVLKQFETCCECLGWAYDPREDSRDEGPCEFCHGRGYRRKDD